MSRGKRTGRPLKDGGRAQAYLEDMGPLADKAEMALLQELDRMGIKNDPIPEKCPKCGSEEYKRHGGMVGEDMLFCAKCGEYIWEDHEGAIRSVF